MPRAKKPKIQPIESGVFELDGEERGFDVWENHADEGTRGAHTRSKRSKVFDAVVGHCENALTGNSNITKQHISRLIYGPETLTAFGKFITIIAKKENIVIGKTLAEEIAQAVRMVYKAMNAALAEKNYWPEKNNPSAKPCVS
jgi:hypothetical protein